MPTFEKTIFTNLGIGFVNDLNSAHSKLVSATSVYSSTDLSGMSDDDIKNMTDIANKELTANCDIIKVDNKQTKIRSTANNESLKQGIYIRSYATYVVDQDGNQTLLAVKVNTKPQFLPAFDGVNTSAQSYGFNVGISQTDSVMFTKLSNLSVTHDELSGYLSSKADLSSVADLKSSISNVSSAIANNSGIASSFSSVNIGVATNSTAINVLQTNFSSNYSAINTLQSNAISNSSGIKLLQTSVSNVANSIATNSNNIASLNSSISLVSSNASSSANSNALRAFEDEQSIKNNSSAIKDLDNSVLKIMPVTDGIDFWGLAPGIYQFTGQLVLHNPYNSSSTLFGVSVSYGNQIIYYDQNGTIWCLSPKSGSWVQLAKGNDLVNLQNTVNGVLARQSNLNNLMFNNLIPDLTTSYNFSTNVITVTSGSINNSDSGNAHYVSTILYAYAKSIGKNSVSASLINSGKYPGVNGLWINNTSNKAIFAFDVPMFAGMVNVAGLKIQLSFN